MEALLLSIPKFFWIRREWRERSRNTGEANPSTRKVMPRKPSCTSRTGGVKLTVVNGSGKEAVVAMFGPTDFFGEGCMAGQTLRMGTTTAVTPTTLLVIQKNELLRVLHAEHELSDHFIAYMLKHNIRVEEDLIDQLFNSSEKRLARTLAAARAIRETRTTGRHAAESFPGDAGEHDRNDAFACEFFHEQIQETGLHRIQREDQGQ